MGWLVLGIVKGKAVISSSLYVQWNLNIIKDMLVPWKFSFIERCLYLVVHNTGSKQMSFIIEWYLRVSIIKLSS